MSFVQPFSLKGMQPVAPANNLLLVAFLPYKFQLSSQLDRNTLNSTSITQSQQQRAFHDNDIDRRESEFSCQWHGLWVGSTHLQIIKCLTHFLSIVLKML
jgi:hypothetical protein